MDKKNQEYPQNNNQVLTEEDLDLDAIMKEFSHEEESFSVEVRDDFDKEIPEPEESASIDQTLEEFLQEEDEEEPEETDLGDTVRINLIPSQKEEDEDLGDTIRLDNVVKAVKEQLPEEPEETDEPVALDEPEEIRIAQPNLPHKEEPYSENWEP